MLANAVPGTDEVEVEGSVTKGAETDEVEVEGSLIVALEADKVEVEGSVTEGAEIDMEVSDGVDGADGACGMLSRSSSLSMVSALLYAFFRCVEGLSEVWARFLPLSER